MAMPNCKIIVSAIIASFFQFPRSYNRDWFAASMMVITWSFWYLKADAMLDSWIQCLLLHLLHPLLERTYTKVPAKLFQLVLFIYRLIIWYRTSALGFHHKRQGSLPLWIGGIATGVPRSYLFYLGSGCLQIAKCLGRWMVATSSQKLVWLVHNCLKPLANVSRSCWSIATAGFFMSERGSTLISRVPIFDPPTGLNVGIDNTIR